MYDVLKIVNWMRVKNKAELIENENAEELTQMKAMKLLYYVQGVSLVYLKHRMFPNDILAWKYGRAVWKVDDKYQGEPQIFCQLWENDIDDYNELSANSKVNDVLNTVWDTFGYMSASQLLKQTHKESPWKNTKQSEVITDDEMKKYFSKIVSEWDEDSKSG